MKRDNPTHFLIVIKVSHVERVLSSFLCPVISSQYVLLILVLGKRFSRGNDASSLSLGRTKELIKEYGRGENLLGKGSNLCKPQEEWGEVSLAMS